LDIRIFLPMRYAVLLLFAVASCARPRPSTEQEVQRLAAEVIPRVERSVGLRFRTPPAFAVRTRDQVRQYLIDRLDTEYPPATMRDIALAYRLFGVIPDTLDFRALLLNVLSEQVVGYFDPDSATLYVVDGTDPLQVRLVLAHELVHALQGQYVPLDSILESQGDNDRKMAAQAVLEGQATLASLGAMLDSAQLRRIGSFWGDMREQVRQAQERMPVFSAAPLIVREGLLFPYLAGADFVRWFEAAYPDRQPYGQRMPRSTEQILHPERYRVGDDPTLLRFAPTPVALGTLVYQDDWGEFESRIVLQQLTGSDSLATDAVLGWDGDRFAVFRADGGDAVVWHTIWDDAAAAQRFATVLSRAWERRSAPGRRWTVAAEDLAGRPGVRLIDAPDGWAGWRRPPSVEVGK
jgi:hypothetical protein